MGRGTACGLAVSVRVRWRRAAWPVEGRQEAKYRRRHEEVAQDEMDGSLRGGVEGLAGVEGEDIVGLPPLELPLRHERGGSGVGAGEGLLLPAADRARLCEPLCGPLGERAGEQLHVLLAQGYGLVVVQLG